MGNYPLWALGTLAAFLGACLASFLCVVAERVPHHQSIGGRSHCVCGRQLRGIENVPIFSWLVLRGRSSCCHVKIPIFYELAEVSSASLFALSALSRNIVLMVLVDLVTLALVVALGWRRATRS